MKPNFLPIAVKNSGIALEDLVPQVLAAPPRLKHYLHICLLYRRMAVGSLLMSSDPELFYAALFKSSRAFLHFLTTAPEEEKVTSKSEPFFDAIACHDQDGALAIARASRMTLATGREYEDDFFYLRFLMEHFFLGTPEDALRRKLDDWAALTGGNPDPHLELCRALLDKNQSAFDSALATGIEQRQERIEKQRARETLHPDEAATLAHVSTEVLAWLKLAEQAGLTVARDHPLAPGVARLFHRIRFPTPDSWRIPPSFRSLPKPTPTRKAP
ncbi:hypothetical protein F0U61_43330 [Archangium violaceum]|uniref:immunity 49 family protein n=1 Tax=Archangium violaceum TaxID=83451 RepID=UPI002B31ECD8|nr:hypothetical protein F0U61_43330 [Archangium violaceum]